MGLPAPTNELRAVRIRIRCQDVHEFEEHFTPWYAAEGIRLPAELAAAVGTPLRVVIELQNGQQVLSGIARIAAKEHSPATTQLRIVRVDAGSVPLAPVLAPVTSPATPQQPPQPPPIRRGGGPPPLPAAQGGLKEALFSDLPPPEDYAAEKPLVIRSSAVKLRLREG